MSGLLHVPQKLDNLEKHIKAGLRQLRHDLGIWNDHEMVADSCDRMYCYACKEGQANIARTVPCLPGMQHKWKETWDDDFCVNCQRWQLPLVRETECRGPKLTKQQRIKRALIQRMADGSMHNSFKRWEDGDAGVCFRLAVTSAYTIQEAHARWNDLLHQESTVSTWRTGHDL